MLILRTAQLAILRRAMFEGAARAFLRRQRPGEAGEAAARDEALVGRVADALEFAASLGAAEAEDRETWAALELERGELARTAPCLAWLRALLGDPGVSPAAKRACAESA